MLWLVWEDSFKMKKEVGVEIKLFDSFNKHDVFFIGRCKNDYSDVIKLIEEAKSKGLNVKSKNIFLE